MRYFDGIICIGGEDWWYHNRGHFDLQMMRELSVCTPILYVNSIGVRVPRIAEGRVFLRRLSNKLKSWLKGYVQVRPHFAVFSPISAPGRIGTALSGWMLPLQIKSAARRAGIRQPLIWVACPPGARLLPHFQSAPVVYQRTDQFESFPAVDRQVLEGYDAALKERADLVLFCAHNLMEKEQADCRKALYTDHGVDFDLFAEAAKSSDSVPADIARVPTPRVGFVGGMDEHTFDPELMIGVAAELPEVSFALVGASSVPDGWCVLPNVYMLGQKPYEEVASYMAACDVLIMPWNKGEWIQNCNPVKLKEYLAVGMPVVSSAFPELKYYDDVVVSCDDARSFVAGIRKGLASPPDPEILRARVRDETWHIKQKRVVDTLAELGIHCRSTTPQSAGE